jgi:hypothetical protein
MKTHLCKYCEKGEKIQSIRRLVQIRKDVKWQKSWRNLHQDREVDREKNNTEERKNICKPEDQNSNKIENLVCRIKLFFYFIISKTN